jgi:hypothetical protein
MTFRSDFVLLGAEKNRGGLGKKKGICNLMQTPLKEHIQV